MNQKNLLEVDWSKIPAPVDDGAAALGLRAREGRRAAQGDHEGRAQGAGAL